MVDLDSVRGHGRQAVVIAGNKVCKKYRRRMWKRECRNLKSILPSVANKTVSDVEVIEEAVGYIEQLERAIAQRLGVLPCPNMIAALHMQHFMKIASQASDPSMLPRSSMPSQMPFLSQQTGMSQLGHNMNMNMKLKQKLATTLRV